MTPPSADPRDRDQYITPPPETTPDPSSHQRFLSSGSTSPAPSEILHLSKTAPPDISHAPNLSSEQVDEILSSVSTSFTRQFPPESPSSPNGQRKSTTTASADSERIEEPLREPIFRDSPQPEISRTWSTPPVVFQHSTPQRPKGIQREKTPAGIQTNPSPLDPAFPSIRTPKTSLEASVDPELEDFRLRPPSEPQSANHFPPLPFQSYLSLALSAGTVSQPNTAPSSSYPPQLDLRGSKPDAGTAYGPPPHHPNDSAALALERLQNFITLPPHLEGAITFGVLACLDSWLYIFTILPLRFLRGLGLLMAFWKESIWGYFNYEGRKLRKPPRKAAVNGVPAGEKEGQNGGEEPTVEPPKTPQQHQSVKKKRERKTASDLLPSHKADILRGLLLIVTCWALMALDASKVYHSIRAQNGIKLYIIYNMLDVGIP